MKSLKDYLPVFWEFGITRKEMLRMKHWEVELLINGYYKHRARNLLALVDVIILGAGMFDDADVKKKLVDNLMIQAGYKKPKPKKVDGSWAKELSLFSKGF